MYKINLKVSFQSTHKIACFLALFIFLTPFLSILWNSEHHHHDEIQFSHDHLITLDEAESSHEMPHEDIFHSDFTQLFSILPKAISFNTVFSIALLFCIIFRFFKPFSPKQIRIFSTSPSHVISLYHQHILLLI